LIGIGLNLVCCELVEFDPFSESFIGIAHLLGVGHCHTDGGCITHPLGQHGGGLTIGGGFTGLIGTIFSFCLQTSIVNNKLQFDVETIPLFCFLIHSIVLESAKVCHLKALFMFSHCIVRTYIIAALTLSGDIFALGEVPFGGQHVNQKFGNS
jgi:hypothetical protein